MFSKVPNSWWIRWRTPGSAPPPRWRNPPGCYPRLTSARSRWAWGVLTEMWASWQNWLVRRWYLMSTCRLVVLIVADKRIFSDSRVRNLSQQKYLNIKTDPFPTIYDSNMLINFIPQVNTGLCLTQKETIKSSSRPINCWHLGQMWSNFPHNWPVSQPLYFHDHLFRLGGRGRRELAGRRHEWRCRGDARIIIITIINIIIIIIITLSRMRGSAARLGAWRPRLAPSVRCRSPWGWRLRPGWPPHPCGLQWSLSASLAKDIRSYYIRSWRQITCTIR